MVRRARAGRPGSAMNGRQSGSESAAVRGPLRTTRPDPPPELLFLVGAFEQFRAGHPIDGWESLAVSQEAWAAAREALDTVDGIRSYSAGRPMVRTGPRGRGPPQCSPHFATSRPTFSRPTVRHGRVPRSTRSPTAARPVAPSRDSRVTCHARAADPTQRANVPRVGIASATSATRRGPRTREPGRRYDTVSP